MHSRTFTASLPSSVEQSNDAALYRVEMQKEQTLFQAAKVLITMHDGSLIKCKSVVEDYVFHSADDTPGAALRAAQSGSGPRFSECTKITAIRARALF